MDGSSNPLSMNACEGTEVAFNMGTARHGRRHFSTKKQIRLHIAIWVAVPTQLKLLNNTSVSIRFYCTPQLQALEAVACAHGVVGMAAQCIWSISVTSVKHQGHYGTSLKTQGTAHSDKGSTCCGLMNFNLTWETMWKEWIGMSDGNRIPTQMFLVHNGFSCTINSQWSEGWAPTS